MTIEHTNQLEKEYVELTSGITQVNYEFLDIAAFYYWYTLPLLPCYSTVAVWRIKKLKS